jgi:hypothetical protein
MLKHLKFKKMKNLKSIAVILIASMFITNSTTAQKSTLVKTDNNFSVKYAGLEDNYLCFLIEINDMDGKNKTLKINDKVEGDLYVENWATKYSIQKFKIERNGNQILTFNLSAGNKNYSKTYSFTTQLTEKTIVKEDEFVAL